MKNNDESKYGPSKESQAQAAAQSKSFQPIRRSSTSLSIPSSFAYSPSTTSLSTLSSISPFSISKTITTPCGFPTTPPFCSSSALSSSLPPRSAFDARPLSQPCSLPESPPSRPSSPKLPSPYVAFKPSPRNAATTVSDVGTSSFIFSTLSPTQPPFYPSYITTASSRKSQTNISQSLPHRTSTTSIPRSHPTFCPSTTTTISLFNSPTTIPRSSTRSLSTTTISRPYSGPTFYPIFNEPPSYPTNSPQYYSPFFPPSYPPSHSSFPDVDVSGSNSPTPSQVLMQPPHSSIVHTDAHSGQYSAQIYKPPPSYQIEQASWPDSPPATSLNPNNILTTQPPIPGEVQEKNSSSCREVTTTMLKFNSIQEQVTNQYDILERVPTSTIKRISSRASLEYNITQEQETIQPEVREADPSLSFDKVSSRELLLYATNQEYDPNPPHDHFPPGIPYIQGSVESVDNCGNRHHQPPHQKQHPNISTSLQGKQGVTQHQQAEKLQNKQKGHRQQVLIATQIPPSMLQKTNLYIQEQVPKVRGNLNRPSTTPNYGEQQFRKPSPVHGSHFVAANNSNYQFASAIKPPPRSFSSLAEGKEESVKTVKQRKGLRRSKKQSLSLPVQGSSALPRIPQSQIPTQGSLPLLNLPVHEQKKSSATVISKKPTKKGYHTNQLLLPEKQPQLLQEQKKLPLIKNARKSVKKDCWKKPFKILQKQLTFPPIHGHEGQGPISVSISKKYYYYRNSSLSEIPEIPENSEKLPSNSEEGNSNVLEKQPISNLSRIPKIIEKQISNLAVLDQKTFTPVSVTNASIKEDRDIELPKVIEKSLIPKPITLQEQRKLPTTFSPLKSIKKVRKAQRIPGLLGNLPSLPVQGTKQKSRMPDSGVQILPTIREDTEAVKEPVLDPEKPLPINTSIKLDIERDYSFRWLFAPNNPATLPEANSTKIEFEKNRSLFTENGPDAPPFEVPPFGAKLGTVPPFPQPRPRDLPPYDPFPGSAPPPPPFRPPTSKSMVLPCLPFTGPLTVDNWPLSTGTEVTYTAPIVPVPECDDPVLSSKIVRLTGPLSSTFWGDRLWRKYDIEELP